MSESDPAQQTSETLARFRELKERCLASADWTASSEDALLLHQAALLIGKPLPEEALTDPVAALKLLVMASAVLESEVPPDKPAPENSQALGNGTEHHGFGGAWNEQWLLWLLAGLVLAGVLFAVWWMRSPVTPCCKTFWPGNP